MSGTIFCSNIFFFEFSGKVMGGTTVLNGLMYCRGDSSNYDEYEALGAKGWGYKDVLPYFLKSENNLQFNVKYRHKKEI